MCKCMFVSLQKLVYFERVKVVLDCFKEIHGKQSRHYDSGPTYAIEHISFCHFILLLKSKC